MPSQEKCRPARRLTGRALVAAVKERLDAGDVLGAAATIPPGTRWYTTSSHAACELWVSAVEAFIESAEAASGENQRALVFPAARLLRHFDVNGGRDRVIRRWRERLTQASAKLSRLTRDWVCAPAPVNAAELTLAAEVLLRAGLYQALADVVRWSDAVAPRPEERLHLAELANTGARWIRAGWAKSPPRWLVELIALDEGPADREVSGFCLMARRSSAAPRFDTPPLSVPLAGSNVLPFRRRPVLGSDEEELPVC